MDPILIGASVLWGIGIILLGIYFYKSIKSGDDGKY